MFIEQLLYVKHQGHNNEAEETRPSSWPYSLQWWQSDNLIPGSIMTNYKGKFQEVVKKIPSQLLCTKCVVPTHPPPGPLYDGIWRWGPLEVIWFQMRSWGWAPDDGISILMRRRETRGPALSTKWELWQTNVYCSFQTVYGILSEQPKLTNKHQWRQNPFPEVGYCKLEYWNGGCELSWGGWGTVRTPLTHTHAQLGNCNHRSMAAKLAGWKVPVHLSILNTCSYRLKKISWYWW